MTQEELAQSARLSVRALRDIELDRAVPRTSSILRIGRALRLTRPAHTEQDAESGLRIEVLGSLSIRDGGTRIVVNSPTQQTLLGLLAIQPGKAVPVDEIADVIWGNNPPPSWRNLVHVHVNKLRGSLEPDRTPFCGQSIIVADPSSYRLAVEGLSLDLARFKQLLESARRCADAGDGSAWHEYGQALALWRGGVLAGPQDRLRHHPAAQAVHRLRISAALEFSRLCAGPEQHAQAKEVLWEIAELEPLHEGVHAQLMTALAATGERAAALQLFASMRLRLAEELGICPGAEMTQAHLELLRLEQFGYRVQLGY